MKSLSRSSKRLGAFIFNRGKAIINRIRVIIKFFMPQYRIVFQKIEKEELILITSLKPEEGLTPLVTDKNRLLRYLQRNRKQNSTMFTQEGTISFQPISTSVEYIGEKDTTHSSGIHSRF